MKLETSITAPKAREVTRRALEEIYKDIIAPIKEGDLKILELYSNKDVKSLPDLIEKQVPRYGKLILELEELAGRLRYDKLPIVEDNNGDKYYCISDREGRSLIISQDSAQIYTPNPAEDSSNDNYIEVDDNNYKPFTIENSDYMKEYMEIARLCLARINEHRHGFIAEVQR